MAATGECHNSDWSRFPRNLNTGEWALAVTLASVQLPKHRSRPVGPKLSTVPLYSRSSQGNCIELPLIPV